ncbi:MAG TPA: RnfABCDGE type electron transport complex subunit D [Humisphaera sp.]|jgi:Na+-translocating ferredoxin:NAD+ oxidoreductase RnfD subunit|nr:RnfABCDGE type electron transport complex subunit D [Humisphaera sp.]
MTAAALAKPPELMSLPHSGVRVREYFAMHFQGAIFPLTAAAAFYGWRGLMVVLLVIAGAWPALIIWRQIGRRGRQLESSNVMLYALLLALMLPGHLASVRTNLLGVTLWPLPLAAGILLVITIWTLGGLGAGRLHPVVVTYLILATLFGGLLVPQAVLSRSRIYLGDLLAGKPGDRMPASKDPWLARHDAPNQETQFSEPASQVLTRYTSGREKPPRGWLPLQALLRDSLPPLEDLIIGGHPGPIGAGSAIAVIIGGLMLMYRGLIDFRVPLTIMLVAFVVLLVLPIPVAIGAQTIWHSMAFRRGDVGWAVGVTLANYELMASPILFMAFFLATAGTMQPTSGRARLVYAALIGVASAALQLYFSAAIGPYIALLLAGILTPFLDKIFRVRPLVALAR